MAMGTASPVLPKRLSVAWRRRAAQRCGAVPPRLSQTLRAAPRAATSPAPRGSSPGSPGDRRLANMHLNIYTYIY